MSNTPSNNTEFKILFEEYYGPFCLYAKRFIKDIDICKDIVSESFIVYWQEYQNGNIDSKTALAYIKTCVKNRAFNHLKHQDIEWSHIEYIMNCPPDYAEDPEHILSLSELYRLLTESLNKLPTEYKEVFIQSVMKKRSHEEIAENLKISLRSVNRYKQRVLGQLQLDLKDYLPLLVITVPLLNKYFE